MTFERKESFRSDFRRLSESEKQLFRGAVRQMNAAYDGRGDVPLPRWPASLRVKSVEGTPGVWEMTWTFAGPNGRATFEYVDVAGEAAIRCCGLAIIPSFGVREAGRWR